jgi:hypothetical protein
LLAEREYEWLKRLTTDPASFASVELEVHEQARQQADLYVAGLLAKASTQPEKVPHIDKLIGRSGFAAGWGERAGWVVQSEILV